MKKKTKICFVTTVSSTIRAFILETAIYLHENAGFDITFISNYDEQFEKDIPTYINYIPVKMSRGVSFSGITATYKLYRIFRKQKFDVVQYSTPNASFYSSIASYFARIKIRIYSQWGLIYVSFSGVKRAVFKRIEKITCLFSSRIQPDSYGNLHYCIQEKLYRESKVKVIWNGSASGVNFNRFDINSKKLWRIQFRERYGIPINTFVIGFVGRITKDKGINELLSAFKIFIADKNDVMMIIAGQPEGIDTLDFELFEWSKSSDKIIYSGFLSKIEYLYSSIDAFILPSYREGFGSVLIESLAMENIVVTTDIPGPSEVISHKKNGFKVRPRNTSDLVEILEFIYFNREDSSKMAMSGRLMVMERYDSVTLQKKILINLNNLLGGD